MPAISRNTTIEELVNKFPFAVGFLSEHGIRCIRCGEPVWGTLEEAMLEKDFSQDKIEEVLAKLNQLIADESGSR